MSAHVEGGEDTEITQDEETGALRFTAHTKSKPSPKYFGPEDNYTFGFRLRRAVRQLGFWKKKKNKKNKGGGGGGFFGGAVGGATSVLTPFSHANNGGSSNQGT